MVSLIVHAILGIAVIAFIVAANRSIFARPATGPAVSLLEVVYYVVGIASVVLGWYFNIRYVAEYHVSNPITGWIDYITLMFANPAAGSAGQDYTIGNVILLPLMTIIDGYRRGIRRPWLYFVSSLFTSFVFAWAFYLVTVERQRRHQMTRAVAA
ncbi:DUF2834 domain-containing protein [Mycobacteroides franklinii]|uniref:DUF2834 domain-containing protein n=1 Tax=Mycobacteroides franklinii TaxID=948102 RepID=A0A4R8R692_9MYCO|nr:DUF2834 domain-containing protein [Mycobacteroides franklinii]TDZ43113.1 hypothetical protein CCUG64054_03166 [Mycobacteroides franklinii]TDZ50248.1 hypothetical protein CCUG63697_01752 [Mycobacteroides franklinii]TDZ56668.1 hypothetical protein CCUG63696_03168 [Mycobacteroides franklinii]TDZ63609.1 hypothetical protein CCUG63695_03093 [Mycobacteroides franklinii]TDZ70006.1 hypothetical protein CCUG64056_03166 [Mycobacteroides franklinii]